VKQNFTVKTMFPLKSVKSDNLFTALGSDSRRNCIPVQVFLYLNIGGGLFTACSNSQRA